MVAEASLFSRYHTTQRKTHQIRKTTNTIPHHQVRNRISLRNHAKRVTVGAPNAWRKSRARRRLAANTALLAFDPRPKPCLASQCSVLCITKPAHYTAPCTHAHAAALAMGARARNHRNTRKLALPHSKQNLPRRTLLDSDAPPPTPIAHHATRKKCARAGDAPLTTETHARLSPSTRCGDANRRRGAAATEPTPSRKHALPPPPNRGNLNTAALANPRLGAVHPSTPPRGKGRDQRGATDDTRDANVPTPKPHAASRSSQPTARRQPVLHASKRSTAAAENITSTSSPLCVEGQRDGTTGNSTQRLRAIAARCIGGSPRSRSFVAAATLVGRPQLTVRRARVQAVVVHLDPRSPDLAWAVPIASADPSKSMTPRRRTAPSTRSNHTRG